MNIKEMIRSGETETVEFKESFSDTVIETLTAFANTSGGAVLVGVADDGSIKGVSVSKEIIPRWLNEIKTKTSAAIVPGIDIKKTGGKTVACFKIPEYPVKPVSFRGRYYKRRSNSNHMMTTEEVADMHLQTLNTSWDCYPDRDHTTDDISFDKVKSFINRANRFRTNPITDDPETVLKKYNLIREGSITYGCYLLFVKDRCFFSTINTGLFQTEIVIKDSVTIETDLFQEIDEVLTFITKHINKELIITGEPEHEARWDYPLDAVREIVINMIIHRDYRSSSNSIIKIFPDRIEFYNPGKLLPGLTIEKLLKGDYTSFIRNKQIAGIFKEANEIEQYGSGIRRIVDSCLKYNLPNPKFEEFVGGFRVTVFKTPQKTTQITTQKTTQKMTLSEEILSVIRDNPGVTRNGIAEALKISPNTVKEYIAKLKKEGKLKRIGPDRGGYWEVVE